MTYEPDAPKIIWREEDNTQPDPDRFSQDILWHEGGDVPQDASKFPQNIIWEESDNNRHDHRDDENPQNKKGVFRHPGILIGSAVFLLSIIILSAVLVGVYNQRPNSGPTSLQSSNHSLLEAAWQGDMENARKALSQGADVNFQDKTGKTPLIRAIEFGDSLRMVQYLVSKGADIERPNSEKETPLLVAIYGGNLDIVKFLVEKGANLKTEDADGVTPLMAAKGAPDIEDFLQHQEK
jgi:hypothetical protein